MPLIDNISSKTKIVEIMLKKILKYFDDIKQNDKFA
jgi:hypothetical protein